MWGRFWIAAASLLLFFGVAQAAVAQDDLWQPIHEQAKTLLQEAGYDWEGRPHRGLTAEERKAYWQAEQRYYELVLRNAEPLFFDDVVTLYQQFSLMKLPKSKEAEVIGSEAWYHRIAKEDLWLKTRYLANAKIMAGMEPELRKAVFGDFGLKHFDGQRTPLIAVTALGTSSDPRKYEQLQRFAERLVNEVPPYNPFGCECCVRYLTSDPSRDRLKSLEAILLANLAERQRIANDQTLPGPVQGEARRKIWHTNAYLGMIRRGLVVRQLADRMKPEQRNAFLDFYSRLVAPLPFLPKQGAIKSWSDIIYFPEVFQPQPGDKQFYLPFLLHCGDLPREVRCVAELCKLEKTPFAVEQIKKLAESDATHARVAQEILDYWKNPPSEEERAMWLGN